MNIGSGYIQKQNETVEICKMCKYRKQYIEQRNKANAYDNLVEAIKKKMAEEKEKIIYFSKTGNNEITYRHAYAKEVLQELLEEK